ncbi:MAG: polysaccharide biosynthesis/export family protein [Bacteroidia bacterium]|nr:polysaccharide biosynthesis/export family protein [Bacteroidia bacterium]MBT8309600.1 polysaccharide biosynthesis/export family protein [Bacteroidia bacterium]NND10051.1 sugar transporter [Flavobacteriaceae bacterium]NNK26772.1 sugar transporter [Flavobacteriaceae bacterium]NNL60532.1 sugar transporter [Flavobacteriaceae bacterium]
MKKTIFAIGLIFTVLATSCIPQKEILYLQDDSGDSQEIIGVQEIQKPYRIQINDIISIRIKVLDQNAVSIFNPIGSEDNMNASGAERAYFDGFTVDVQGNIRVPTLGQINVLGKTTSEVEELIEKKLLEEQFKETANIFVTVKLSGVRFTVNGEVSNPGSYTLFQERVNIFEAIANVGDILITGDRKDILIVRQYPQGQKIHHIDLTSVSAFKSPYYYIQPNDIIYVKPLKQKSWGTGTTGVQSLSTIISVLSLVTTSILLVRNL